MLFTRTMLTTIAIALVTLPCLADEPLPFPSSAAVAASKPANGPATSGVSKIPVDVIKQIRTTFEGRGSQPTVALVQDLVKMCEDTEKQFASADDLYQVQLPMLQAQAWVAARTGDSADQKKMLEIAMRIVDGNAPASQKLSADTIITVSRMQGPTGEITDKEAAAREIRGIVSRYEKTDAAANAIMLGIRLSARAGQKDLVDELGNILEEKYATVRGARGMLRDLGRSVDAGKPFEAELTKLDGSKLSLPKDLLGKVVVVDFWATWCPPCVASIPHMKDVYAKYKDRGVVFVGISLDRADDKAKLEKFVKDKGVEWPQTYTGKFWDDPTARKYSITEIPSVWVVGKDGKVVAENAGENLEETLAKALKAEAATNPTASSPTGK